MCSSINVVVRPVTWNYPKRTAFETMLSYICKDLLRLPYPGFHLWVHNVHKEDVQAAVSLWAEKASERVARSRSKITRDNYGDMAFEFYYRNLRRGGNNGGRRPTFDVVDIVHEMLASGAYHLDMTGFAYAPTDRLRQGGWTLERLDSL